MQILFLVQNLRKPSCRFRVLEMIPHLADHGIESDVREIPAGRLARRRALSRGPDAFDAVVLARKLLVAADLARLRRAAHALIYDFDDALMYRDPTRRRSNSLLRRIRFSRIVRAADTVIAGNPVLAAEARGCTSATVHVIPTAVDTDRYRPVPRQERRETCVGWLGSKGSIWQFDRLGETWRTIVDRSNGAVRFRVVSDVAPRCAGPGIEHVRWSPDAELESLAAFDLGVMPLVDHPFTRGKCAFKILQYFASGLPAVASPVGMNRDVIDARVNGLFAASPEEWIAAVETLVAHRELRKELGANARVLVAERFSLKRIAGQLANVIKETASLKGEAG